MTSIKSMVVTNVPCPMNDMVTGAAKDALAHDISRFDIVNFCDDEQEKPSDYL